MALFTIFLCPMVYMSSGSIHPYGSIAHGFVSHGCMTYDSIAHSSWFYGQWLHDPWFYNHWFYGTWLSHGSKTHGSVGHGSVANGSEAHGSMASLGTRIWSLCLQFSFQTTALPTVPPNFDDFKDCNYHSKHYQWCQILASSKI